jgi:DNA polymerase-3 subunit epsilon
LLAQIEKYELTEWEDKQGKRSIPVVGDVEALHKFTNLNRTVDFAGRMVYNDAGEELFNFGKHKGKKVEDVFNIEPSYYSWMMNGDFPLYTKRQLEGIYKRWNTKRQAVRQANPPQPKPAEAQPKIATPVKDFKNNNNYQQKPFVKREEKPAKPVDEDMLKLLADKFKKG